MKIDWYGAGRMLPLRFNFYLTLLGVLAGPGLTPSVWAADYYGAAHYAESKKFWVGYADNVGMAQMELPDGGAILIGSRISYPDRDLLFLKTRSDGSVQWQKVLSHANVVGFQQNNLPANRYRGASVAASVDGNYVATFATESVKDVVSVVVIKFSDTGVVHWFRSYRVNVSERVFPTHIVALSDGSAVVMANLENRVNQTLLMKIAGDGTLLAHKILENPDRHHYFKGRSLTKGVNDSLFVVASASEDEGDAIAKLDADLNVTSLNHYFSDNVHLDLQALQQRADGLVGVAATVGSGADSDLGMITLGDNGRPLRAFTVNASAGDEASSIAVTRDGGFFVGGYTGASAPDAPEQTIFVAADHAFGLRVDSDGQFLWAKTYSTKRWNWPLSREIVTNVSADANGDLIMAGASYMADHWAVMRLQLNAEGNMPGSSVRVGSGALVGEITIGSRQGDISVMKDTVVTTTINSVAVNPVHLVVHKY